MLTLYLSALFAGGGLLLFTLMAGGEHDSELELDGDVDGDFSHEMDGDFDLGAWLPVASLRFWTFFAAFFGLLGTVLHFASSLGSSVVLGTSLGVGYFCGLGATRIIGNLTKSEVGKVVGERELIGATGVLLLPASPGQPGKIRMHLGDRLIEEIVCSEREALKLGARVMVIGQGKDGRLEVAPTPLLGGDSEEKS